MADKKKAPKAESVQRAKSFLIKAVGKNDPKTLDRIMKAGYPIEEPIQSHGKQTPLMYAVSVGQPEVINLLLTYEPSFFAKDICGRTVLHYCCRGGNIQNLRLILSKIADQPQLIEMRSNGGVTPLMSAIQSANVYMVGHCLNSSFNPFAIDNTGKSCLDYAAPFRDVNGENIRELILTAQRQWQDQLTPEQIEQRKAAPVIPEAFQDLYNDV